MEAGYPIAAAIAAVPATLAWLSARKIKKNVGETNGAGTVAQMNEAMLVAFDAHAKLDDQRFQDLSKQIEYAAADVMNNTDRKAAGIVADSHRNEE